ncbi:cathepsin Q-like [Pectinophora gossypiella]|uniref:cathepsin Q-like n=1 Tax=Pectinophora gossypiella TaxID=13191 RepID=UPI00214E6DF9|nr:cathepsin Q-like [Pectinophora gossypiella]
MIIKILLLIFVVSSVKAEKEETEKYDFKTEKELMDAWKAYKIKYGKSYGPAEDAIHLREFVKSCRLITKQNKLYDQGLSTSVAGLNEFADMTDEEMKPWRG